MKLSELHIENYKSIAKASLNIQPDFVALVGENNVGKSNIIQALDFLFHKPPRMGKSDFESIVFVNDSSRQIRISSVFDHLTESDRSGLRMYDRGEMIAIQRVAWLEDGNVKNECHGAISGVSIEDFEWADSEFQGFRETNQRNIPELLLVPAIRDVSEETKNKADFFGKVISSIVEAIPDEGLQNAKQLEVELDKMLNYTGSGTDNRLAQIRELEASLLELVSSYIPDIRLFLQFPIPNYRDTGIPRIMLDDGIRGLPATKGHGLQSVLFLAIVRLYEKYLINHDRDRRRPLIFGIEEPEIYLHPTLQRTMFKALQDISRVDQVVVSTHSPHFVDMSNFETVTKVTKRGQDGTNVIQASSSLVPVEREQRIKIFSRFNSQRNEMFFAKKVILVEGDGDKCAVQMCADLMERHLDSKDIVVVETNGKPNMSHYIKVAQAFGIPFAVAYDTDTGIGQSEGHTQSIRTLLSTCDKCLMSVEFEPNLEADLGLPGQHMSSTDVLRHFELMSADRIPPSLRRLVETVEQ